MQHQKPKNSLPINTESKLIGKLTLVPAGTVGKIYGPEGCVDIISKQDNIYLSVDSDNADPGVIFSSGDVVFYSIDSVVFL